ncbi:MAG: SMP-30/gluconolactonase/LRE family protein [Novosphingobium sp.]|nr:SMP-30/gluconolactonase/LRE family protein [Novosphingobium sp.]
MIVISDVETVVEGLTVPECPRWHDGALYYSDIRGGRVYRLEERGKPELLYQSPDDFVGGLGFLDNGDLLVVSSRKRALLRLSADGVQVHADLSGLCRFVLNDMVVAGDRAYVSQPGYNIWDDQTPGMPPPTDILTVAPDGQTAIAAGEMLSPNGMAIGADGRTLYVAESTGMRISAFTIDPASGALSDRRVFAQLPDGAIPDGMCLDDAGGVWAASPVAYADGAVAPGPGVLRVVEGGEATHVVRLAEGRRALACAFGGADRRTLYICTTVDFEGSSDFDVGQGRIERVRLDLRGAGIP